MKIFHLIQFLIVIMIRKTHSKCTLSNGCEAINSNPGKNAILYYCSQINTRFEESFSHVVSFNKCHTINERQLLFLKIYVRPSRFTILDSAFDVEGLHNAFMSIYKEKRALLNFYLVLGEIRGFELSAFNLEHRIRKIEKKLLMNIFIDVYDILFEFYSRNKRIESCEEYLRGWENSGRGENLFQACAPNCQLSFRRATFARPICPIAFNNTNLEGLEFIGLINRFYKVNFIRFLDYSNSMNSSIYFVTFTDIDGINIDRNFLNANLFNNTELIEIFGRIPSVQVDLFSAPNFSKLKKITIGLQFFHPLIHKQGIEWIRYINNDLYYNFSVNLTSYEKSRKKDLLLAFSTPKSFLEIFDENDLDSYFLDKDFCLYLKFPFRQLVFITLENSMYIKSFSCTLAWLLQYHHNVFLSTDFNHTKIKETIKKCNYTKMQYLCNKSNMNLRDYSFSFYDIRSSMVVWEFASIIFSPFICVIGIISNIVVVVVISSKKNQKELKENHYAYMRLKSIVNCFILFIEIFSLMNICQSNSGAYCSSIFKLLPIQYFKIIFTEFLCSYFRFISNLFHVAFTVNRLALIGKEHSKFTEYISKMRERNFVIFCLILSLFVALPKGFQYRANVNLVDNEYPFVYTDEKSIGIYGLKMAISILSAFCDFLNGPVFLVFSICVDVQLFVAMRRTTAEKLQKLETMSANSDSTKKSLKEAVFRAILMLVFNSLANLLLKTPNTIASTVNLVRFVNGYNNNLLYNHVLISQDKKWISQVAPFIKYEILNMRQAFERFADCLFVLSIGVDFLFYYNFDLKFKEAFFIVFPTFKSTLS